MPYLLVRAQIHAFLSLIATTCAVTLSAWVLLYTSVGLEFIVNAAHFLTPYQIQYERLEGSLFQGFEVHKLDAVISDTHVNADALTFAFNPKALFVAQLHVTEWRMENVLFQLVDDGSSSTELSPFSLEQAKAFIEEPSWLNIKIDTLTIDGLTIRSTQDEHIDVIKIDDLDTSQGYQNGLRSMEVRASKGYVHIKTTDKLNANWNIKLAHVERFFSDVEGELITRGNLCLDASETSPSLFVSAKIQSKRLAFDGHEIKASRIDVKGGLDDVELEAKIHFDDHIINAGLTCKAQKKGWLWTMKPSKWRHPALGEMPTFSGMLHTEFNAGLHLSASLKAFSNPIDADITLDLNTFALSGFVKGDFTSFRAIERFFPELSSISGNTHVFIGLKGTLMAPLWYGQANVTDVHLPIKENGTHIHVSTLELRSQGHGNIRFEGRGDIGDSPYTIHGHMAFDKTFRFEAWLKGDRLVLSRTPDLFLLADANLHLRYEDGLSTIDGLLHVPQMDMIMETWSDYQAPSSDVVFVKNKKPIQAPSRPIYERVQANITLKLGENVRFRGFDIDTKGQGSVVLTKQPETPWQAKGKIELKQAQYMIQNKWLEIDRGILSWAHAPILNPSLDIKGTREVKILNDEQGFTQERARVGAHLTGTVRRPHIVLISNANINDGDVLSYALLDKPIAQAASTAEAQILSQAFNQLRGNFLTSSQSSKTIAQRLGVDSIEFSNTLEKDKGFLEQTTLLVSKQISNRLRAQVSFGMDESARYVNLRYLMGKNLTLETQAHQNSISADIVFTFETD